MNYEIKTTDNFAPEEMDNFYQSIKIPKDIKKQLYIILGKNFCKSPVTATHEDWLHAVSWLIRGMVSTKMLECKRKEKEEKPKFVNYLSMEFLIGKMLQKAAKSIGFYDEICEVLKEVGLDFNQIAGSEPEPALGNGGLGRLASCFIDSMATLGIPTFGYGIRYEYGMFTQQIDHGRQMEVPDTWLNRGYIWEMPRHEIRYLIPIGGVLFRRDDGEEYREDVRQIYAKAYDIMVPGHATNQVSRIRLWSASSSEEVIPGLLEEGDYARAFFEKQNTENISGVLYPDDSTDNGKKLRLQQEYFFSSASVQDILYRFSNNERDFSKLPDHCSIHLNDTHPALAVPSMMKHLTETYKVPWDEASQISRRVFSYTNHTLMPEALETWSVNIMQEVCPDLVNIIYRINEDFLSETRKKNTDQNLIRNVSIVDENYPRKFRMANLSVIASSKVNGVSKIHSELMKATIFKDFASLDSDKFINITNGVTPRRWIMHVNPELSALIDEKIGSEWRNDLLHLLQLNEMVNDEVLQNRFAEVKKTKKIQLANFLKKNLDVEINTDSIFDMQIKRIHEYKRQLMNILHVIHLYNRALENPEEMQQPRTFFFAGKAASSYYMAKLIIRFIHDVADRINNDNRVNQFLKVVFVPNYSVSIAEKMIPAADVSEQISTAGTEASGTSNMKFALNGALTIGTYDGATVEMEEKIGKENMFIFGNTVDELQNLRFSYRPGKLCKEIVEIDTIISQIQHGFFSPGENHRYDNIVNYLTQYDYYLILPDFKSYCRSHQEIGQQYLNRSLWLKKCLINIANASHFSSDESIRNYAHLVWNAEVKTANCEELQAIREQ